MNKSANPYMHRSVCNLEMVGWLVPVTRYAGLAEWLPSWNWNGDVHRNTEPYLHWNALCQSHWVSRSMTNPTSNRYLHIWFKRRNLWFRSFVSNHYVYIYIYILYTYYTYPYFVLTMHLKRDKYFIESILDSIWINK